MPITKSAKKALRGSTRKNKSNDLQKKKMKDVVKKVEKLVKDKNVAEAKKMLPKVYSALDKAAKKGIIKKNNASNQKARMSRITK